MPTINLTSHVLSVDNAKQAHMYGWKLGAYLLMMTTMQQEATKTNYGNEVDNEVIKASTYNTSFNYSTNFRLLNSKLIKQNRKTIAYEREGYKQLS